MQRNKARNQPPTRFRVQIKGATSTPRVDRENGIIHGLSVTSSGEALGHKGWNDSVLLSQVVEFGNAAEKGIKARFTHPGMSSDGLGTLLGTITNFSMQNGGGNVFGDLKFAKSAFNTPDGDLANYVMDLAEETPQLAGMSIVFYRDIGAEDKFEVMNEDSEGNFVSPEKENVNNYRHYRAESLSAVDLVDEPAANPKGIFFSQDNLALQATAALDYALGITEEKPALSEINFDADRIKLFFADYIGRNLDAVTSFIKGGSNMEPKEQGTASEDVAVNPPPEEEIVLTAKPEGEKEVVGLSETEQERARIFAIQKEGAELGQEALAEQYAKDGTPEVDASRFMLKQALISHKAALAANVIGANAEANDVGMKPAKTDAQKKGSEILAEDVVKYQAANPDVSYGDAMIALSKQAAKRKED
jgi:hypothetical protein